MSSVLLAWIFMDAGAPLPHIALPSMRAGRTHSRHGGTDLPGFSLGNERDVGFVDLGHIDLLVHEGFYSNRTDFIRTAIRNQLANHADAVKQSIVRHTIDAMASRLGVRRDYVAVLVR